VLYILSCPLREEDKARPYNGEGDLSWLLRDLKGLSYRHTNIEESGVRRDVIFKDRALRRSLELRDRVEEVPQIQSDASEGHNLRCLVHQF
jgi:hypothetical protein